MSVRSTVTSLLGFERGEIVVECRLCGTNVSPGTETCPACGREDIGRYEIPG